MHDTSVMRATIIVLLYVVSIPTSRRSSSLPETYDRVLSTLQSFFISHQIYVSLITRSGNTALLDQILLYVLPSLPHLNSSHVPLRIRSSVHVSRFAVSCDIMNPLSLIPTYRAETLLLWVLSYLSRYGCWPISASVLPLSLLNCKYLSHFMGFRLIGIT